MAKDYTVNGYEFDIDAYINVLNQGAVQKFGRELNLDEKNEVADALRKDIRNYGIIAQNVGIDPKTLNRDAQGNKIIPPFVKPTTRPAREDEIPALKENSPEYFKTNAFGQRVPMTYSEMREKGFVKRNVLLSTMGQFEKAIAGVGALATDISLKEGGATKMFDPKVIAEMIPEQYREKVATIWKGATGLASDYANRLIDTMYEVLPDDIKQSIQYTSDTLGKASAGVKSAGEKIPEGMRTVITNTGKIFRQPRIETLKLTEDLISKMFGKDVESVRNDMLQNTIDYWNDYYAKRTPMARLNPRLDFSKDTLTLDNAKELGEFTAVALLESLPIYLAAATVKNPTALFHTIGAYSAGLQYSEIRDREDMSQAMKEINALGYGGIEATFERILGLGKIAKDIRATKTAGRIFKKSLGRRIWGVLKPGLEEGSEELFTDIGQDAVALLTGEISAKDFELNLSKYGLSFMVGFAGGEVFGGVVSALNKLSGRPENPIENIKTKQEELNAMETTNQELSPTDIDFRVRSADDFRKVASKVREQYVSQVAPSIRSTVETDLNRNIGKQTVASFVEEAISKNISAEEIIRYLKKKKVVTPAVENYLAYLNDPIFGAQLMRPDEFGLIAHKIENNTATATETTRFISKVNEIKTSFSDLKTEIENLKKIEKDKKKLQLKLDQVWYEYTKGIPMKLSRTAMKEVTTAIRNVTPENFEDKATKVLDTMDKYILRAYTQNIKSRAAEGSNVVGKFEPAVKPLLDAIGNTNRVDTSGMLDMFENDAESFTTEIPDWVMKDLEAINGKNISDLTVSEYESLNTALDIIGSSNAFWTATISGDTRLVDVIPQMIERIQAQQKNVESGTWKDIANFFQKNVDRALGELDQASTTGIIFGMELTPDKKTQVYGPIEKVMYLDIENGFHRAEEVELEILDHLTSSLSRENLNRILGDDKEFSNKLHDITINGKVCKLTTDSILAIYMYLNRPKAKNALYDGGFHNKTTATRWTSDMALLGKRIKGRVVSKVKGQEYVSPTPEEKFPTFKIKNADEIKIRKMVESNQNLIEIVDAMRYVLDEIIYPQVNRTYEAIHGRKLDRDQFYFKMMRDASEIDRKATARRFMYFTNEKPGFTRKATYSRAPLDVYNASYVFNRMIRESSNFVGTALPIINLQKVLTKDVRRQIKNSIGDKMLKYLDQYVTDLTTPNFAPEGIESMLLRMQNKIATAVLSFKVVVFVRQLISLTLAIAGMKRYLGGSGVKYILPAVFGKKMNSKELFSRVPSMRARAQGGALAMYSGRDTADLHSKRKLRGITAFDMLAIRTIATGINSYLNDIGQPELLTEKLQLLVNRTQPKFGFASKTRLQRSTVGRLFSMFYSGITTTKNMLIQTLQFMSAGGDKKEGALLLLAILLINNGLHKIADWLNQASKGRKIDLSLDEFAKGLTYKAFELSPFGKLATYALDRAVFGERSYPLELPVLQPWERGADALATAITGAREEDIVKIVRGGLRGLEEIDKFTFGRGISGALDVAEQSAHLFRAVKGEEPYVRIEERDVGKELEEEVELDKKRMINSAKDFMTEFLKALTAEPEDDLGG